MISYEYRCTTCGDMEVEQRITDAALTKCPICGAPVKRMISVPPEAIWKCAGKTPYLGARRLTKWERET